VIGKFILVFGRVARAPAVQTTAALASLPVTAAGMHAVGLSTELDTTTLATGLLESHLWLTLSVAALFGAMGGVVAELLSLRGHVELPHRARRISTNKRAHLADPQYEVDLGIVSRMLLGAAAGMALLAVYAPTNPTSLVVNALIAGSAATGVLRLVQRRMLARPQPLPTSHEPAAAATHAVAPKGQLSIVPEKQVSAA